MESAEVVAEVAAAVGGSATLGLAIAPGVGVGLATASRRWTVPIAQGDPYAVVVAIEATVGPRWVWWSIETANTLVSADIRVARCWDVASVQRLLTGGWRTDSGRVWAQLHDLATAELPAATPDDLFSLMAEPGDEGPVRTDDYLDAYWVAGAWAESVDRLGEWAALAVVAQLRQAPRLGELTANPAALATARSESAAELLCAELAHDGLPMDRGVAEQMITELVGPRPRTTGEMYAQRARRDAEVLRHAPAGANADLRNPAQVRSLLKLIGVDIPDTRAWRLREMEGVHPMLDALLVWRKAERISTTYGYTWLDEHVGVDGRLRGDWSSCDGAAGRMTASAGLHNMPAHMRAAVIAESGYRFVRADLGQIEPRILAAVSGDTALAAATRDDDMYTPVAKELGVDRATAKLAVLGAMYGQTTGQGAHALRRLQASYRVAMAYLEAADVAGQTGRELRTYGGRLIPMGSTNTDGMNDRDARSRAAARGRYARNAVVQGAAAEFFKVWAATMRARSAAFGASIVLCLHDELLIHTPSKAADDVAELLGPAASTRRRRVGRRWTACGSWPISASLIAGPTPSSRLEGGRQERGTHRQMGNGDQPPHESGSGEQRLAADRIAQQCRAQYRTDGATDPADQLVQAVGRSEDRPVERAEGRCSGQDAADASAEPDEHGRRQKRAPEVGSFGDADDQPDRAERGRVPRSRRSARWARIDRPIVHPAGR